MKPLQLALLREQANNAARNLLLAISSLDVNGAYYLAKRLAQFVRVLRKNDI